MDSEKHLMMKIEAASLIFNTYERLKKKKKSACKKIVSQAHSCL